MFSYFKSYYFIITLQRSAPTILIGGTDVYVPIMYYYIPYPAYVGENLTFTGYGFTIFR